MAYVFQTFDKDGNPHPNWKYQYTDFLGHRRTATGTDKRAATEKIASDMEAKHRLIRSGVLPVPKASDEPRPITEVVAEYLAWGKSQGGRGGRPWSIEHAQKRTTHLEWWKAKLPVQLIGDLRLKHAESVLRDHQATRKAQSKKDGKITGKTLQNFAEALCSLCRWAVDRGYLTEDPLAKLVGFDTTPKTLRRALTAGEIRKLLETCPEKHRLIYEVAFTTGLRRGELRALQVRHLDVTAGGIRLEAGFTKNRKAALQPLPPQVLDHLAAAVAGKGATDSLLWVPVHPSVVIQRDLENAGIPVTAPGGKVDFHAARVAFISHILEAGASAKEAQTLARHSNASLTMNVYARARRERLDEVAAAVANAILPVASITEAQRLIAGAPEIDGYSAGTVSYENSEVVEVRGVEPQQRENPPTIQVRRNSQNLRQTSAQIQQTSDIAKKQPAPILHIPDSPRNCADDARIQIRTSYEHNSTDADLRELMSLWPELPASVRLALLRTARENRG